MRFFLPMMIAAVLTANTLASYAASVKETITTARTLREGGNFKKAAAVLKDAIAQGGETLTEKDRSQLTYELDLLDRIRQDFALTKEQLFTQLTKNLKDVTRDEYEEWLKQDRFESRTIDGVEMFANTGVNNLLWRDPDLESRRVTPKSKAAFYRSMLENCRSVKRAAAERQSSYVLPQHHEVTMTVTVDANAARDGELVRAWLPIPRKFPFQSSFQVVSSTPVVNYLADENSSIRSAYFEQRAAKDKKTTFRLTYMYSTRAVRFELDPAKAQPYNAEEKIVQQYTAEAPHVQFTPKIKAMAAEIVGKETNPLRKARAIYDWIGDSLKYSFALEYSTIPNISEYCLTRNYGDCGQQALLFITLCRAEGIPARWQSGWITFPGGKNIHDWTEIYVQPWGWVPVDPEVGGSILKYGTGLNMKERYEIHDFYFGGLDAFRMIANSDHSQQLQPPKKTFRSDDVDFQRGELEAGNKNLYFDKYAYDLQVKPATPK